MTSELPAKMTKLGELHAARKRAVDCAGREKTAAAWIWVQDLDRQIKSLRATLPKPKLVVNNDA
jgi:hypothetical protein